MNQLVIGQDGVTPEAKKPLSRAATVAKTLREIRETLLSATETFQRLKEMFPKWVSAAFDDRWPEYDSQTPFVLARPPTYESERQLQLAKFRRILGEMPPSMDVAIAAGALNQALDTPYEARKVRVIVGFMIDSFPNARPHEPVTYTETLVHELGVAKLPPAAVALACNEIIKTATFLPAVGEVLTKAEEFKKGLESKERLTDRTLNAIAYCEDAIQALKEITGLLEDPPVEKFDWTGPRRMPADEIEF